MLIILQNESSAWMDDKGAKGGRKVDATHHREHTAKPQGIMEQWTVEEVGASTTQQQGGVRRAYGVGEAGQISSLSSSAFSNVSSGFAQPHRIAPHRQIVNRGGERVCISEGR